MAISFYMNPPISEVCSKTSAFVACMHIFYSPACQAIKGLPWGKG
jgi:hypothetical protein